MSKSSFWDHPIEKLEEALSLKKQIHALQTKLSGLFGSEEAEAAPKPTATTTAPKGGRGGRRSFSAATRAKMSASQQARRARMTANHATAATSPLRKKKRNLSPEGRARIVAALKARHAARRAARQ